VAEVITTGTELLIGKVVNTNATWIARKLVELGMIVRRITSVPDDLNEISSCVKEAINRGARVVIVTGGLGPSKDDMTARALANALGQNYVLNREALKMVSQRLELRGLTLTDNRIKMAYMPERATPLPNPVGVAPGILMREGDILIIALPGVPSEMKAIFEKHVLPILERLATKSLVEGSLVVRGIPESDIASLVESLDINEGCEVYVKTRVFRGGVEIYMSSFKQNCYEVIRNALMKVKKAVVEMGGVIINDINVKRSRN